MDKNSDKSPSNPYSRKTHMSVDHGSRRRNHENMTQQEIKAVVEDQIKN